MKQALSFDDVLLVPKFSTINSRKDVDTSVTIAGTSLRVPIISSNMDSVTGSAMASAMKAAGGMGCLHRFWSIQDNVEAFKRGSNPWVSVGLGEKELERAKELYYAGASHVVIDVAHGASMAVVEQCRSIYSILKSNGSIIVGNFATANDIKTFLEYCPYVKTFKVGIGGGSACLTRVVTGCGMPTFSSVLDCATTGVDIIADGGIREPGDFAKAIGAGAKAVMMGGQLAGAEESLAPISKSFYRSYRHVPIEGANPKYYYSDDGIQIHYYKGTPPKEMVERIITHKKYRGSASQESYDVQGKVSPWRTPEGDSFEVPYSGPVANTTQKYEAGLRSAMSYLNASTLEEMRANVEFVTISSNGLKENAAHGKLD